MAVLNDNALVGASGQSKGYQVSRSLRFNSADSAYLSRTPGSAGNRKTWTWSAWVKRGKLGGENQLFTAGSGNTFTYFSIGDNVNDGLTFARYTGSHTFRVSTTQVLRDPSAWYHILLAVDTSQATDTNRVKLYVNGIQVTVFTTTSYPVQNAEYEINNTNDHRIGDRTGNYANSGQFDGYLADIHFIDGQALTPSDFAETDATTGQWIPKAYTGSYGTNGFQLKFADNSNNTATTLGKDTSGNSNNWTPNNFSVSGVTYSNATVTSTTGASGLALSDMFDGNLGTYWQISTPGNHNLTATFATQITGGALVEMYAIRNNPGGGNVISVNGTDITGLMTSSDFAWHDISSVASGGINSITMYRIDGVKNPAISALRVNGVVLVNSSPAGNDSLVDTPTSYGTDTGAGGEVRGNYCTLNPLWCNSAITLSNGNLDLSSTSTAWKSVSSTIAMPTSGKWYFEVLQTVATDYLSVGVAPVGFTLSNHPGSTATSWAWQSHANKWNNNTGTSWGSTTTNGDIIMIAVDRDSGKIWAGKNGTWFSSGNPASGTNEMFSGLGSELLVPAIGAYSTTSCAMNFGARAFSYQAPSGFKALVDTNLTAPVIAKGSTAMDVVTYTGNGSTKTISGLGFSPDFVWIKKRNAAESHHLWDVVRGTTKALYSESTSQELTDPNGLTAFNSDGYTYGSNGGGNALNDTYVAWMWDAGTSTVTNTQGSITSQVRANASAGFSIVSWNSTTQTSHTFGHGLGVAPQFVIVKRRGSTGVWRIGHKSLGWTQALQFDTGAALGADGAYWNNTAPTSTVVSIGDTGQLGGDNIAYCWTPVAGYSAMGSYTGNGSASGDGPFVFCGFRPRFILTKRTDSTNNWTIVDAARNTYNTSNTALFPNLSAQESTNAEYAFDILSNGFKVRGTPGDSVNVSGGTYIYFAVAENPFAYARAR